MIAVPLGLYIHYPWCVKKCPYCDFNSHQQKNDLDQQYLDALLTDLQIQLPDVWGRNVETIFIGGGTPSLIEPEQLNTFFSKLRALLNLRPDIEITLEANPGTIDAVKFKEYSDIGINRLSLGIQSLNDRMLNKLGRIHNQQQALQAVETALELNFNSINCDLMFALPEQTLSQALSDLKTVLEYPVQNLSYYQLTIEPNTYFFAHPPKLPEHDRAFQIHQQAMELLADKGFEQYEVSAFSQPGFQSQHNLNYWQFGDYLGIGAGAHGKITNHAENTIYRTQQTKHPEQYIQQILSTHAQQGSPSQTSSLYFAEARKMHALSKEDLIFEFALNALRLKKGIDIKVFSQRTGLELSDIDAIWKKAQEQGLMQKHPQHFVCTPKGWDFLNELQQLFLL